MLNTQLPPWPNFTPEEAQAVSRVLLSNRVNAWTGDEIHQFEREYATWIGTRHAIALANGTLALEAALHGLGIRPGDEVILSPRTFLASASSIMRLGATPVFADIDRDSQNISAASIAPQISPRTRAIMCIHLAGWPCDMDPIAELASAQGISLIEDCAQAHGARYKGQSVGSLGHVAAWSFCQDKIMTTGGEGGMLTTSDTDIRNRSWSWKDHGKSWQAVHERQHPPGFRWLHEHLGTNARMTQMQAAIGRIQLGRMPDWQAQRQRNAQILMQAARQCPALRVPDIPEHIDHAWYKAYVFVRPEALATGWDRDRIQHSIQQAGIPCMAGSCSEVYRERVFDGTGYRPAHPLPIAQELGQTSLMFLVHPGIQPEHMHQVTDILLQVMAQAQR